MNVLLSSVGRRSYLVDYFRQAVAPEGKVIATNSIAETTGMQAADIACVVPEAGNADFVDTLVEVCRQHRVGLLFSLHDWEAPFIAKAAERFHAIGVRLGISSPAVLDLCLDKMKTYQFCQSHGIPSPMTFSNQADALAAVNSGRLQFPLMVKARYGQGSLALHEVHSADELAAACLLTEAEVKRYADNGLSSDLTSALVIQELVRGEEYGLDVINDFEGRFRACLAKKKLGMRAGETDAAVSVDEPMLSQMGERIGISLGHTAMLDADVIVRGGKPLLVELNPRFGGHYPFGHTAGANAPAALVALAQGREPDPDLLRAAPGIKSQKDLVLRIVENKEKAEPELAAASGDSVSPAGTGRGQMLKTRKYEPRG
jgi:carbamoyl-phosphate synthase large subunit